MPADRQDGKHVSVLLHLFRHRTDVRLFVMHTLKSRITVSVVLFFSLFLFGLETRAADWPAFRADSTRSGYTSESLPDTLNLQWVHQSSAPPQPAWPRLARMPFDRAYHTVISAGTLFFGSSADCAVHSLDASTGKSKWSYVTDGPIRFTPLVWEDRVYFVSDDGYLYCVAQETGTLLWKKRGGTTDEMILGNSRMISQWPARGGPAIRDGVVYFTAGIWPSTGIFIYAVDAKTGKTIWENKNSGKIVMPQPHGGTMAESGVSAQGHLIVTEKHLLIPTGRAVPAVFDRATGKFLYFHLQKHGHSGGSSVMVSGDIFFNSGILFDTQTGTAQGTIGSGVIAQLGDGFAHASANGVAACRWIDKEEKKRDGTTRRVRSLDPYCSVPQIRNVSAIIGVGKKIVTGSQGMVHLIDVDPKRNPEAKKITWTSEVEGKVYGLAVSDGRLFVSTDTGAIYCYGKQATASIAHREPAIDDAPYGENLKAASAVDVILASTGVRNGFCLDYGCGDGALAYALARRTDLRIYAVDEDPKNVAIAREKLTAAGLYGTRVTVHLRKLGETPYPKYIANLIVSGRSISAPFDTAALRDGTKHMLRPFGGQLCVGSPEKVATVTRGPLVGAGEWTHQYGNPANTVYSDDSIQGTLKPLWFRDVGQAMVQRHGRGPSPLFFKGILYSVGLDTLIAVDAYNGTLIWEYAIPGMLDAYDGDQLMGVAGTNSNYCVAPEGVFLRHEQTCFHLDRKTGVKLGEYHLPPPQAASTGQVDPSWGYIACADGLLYGTIANPEHQVTHRWRDSGGDISKLLTESTTLFAMNAQSGKLLWRYDAEHSIRHNAIAIGKHAAYLIDRPLATFDQKRNKRGVHKLGFLLAIDPKSGKTQWKQDKDIFGTLLAVSDDHQSLLMSYQPTRFRLESEVGGRIAVHDLQTGKRRWAKDVQYHSRPLIRQDMIYSQGGAWNVLTGKDRSFEFTRSYGCGILAAGRHMMVFRSATLGYVDFKEEKTVHNFGGMRPGCWINAIPAGGLVLVPDGTAGCECSYQNKTWMALQSQ